MASKWSVAQVPIGTILQHEWVLDSLLKSTKGLSRPGTAKVIVAELMRLIATLEVGGESEHLHFILRTSDFKGSDVRLETGELLDGARQPIPYPAVVWDWRCVQSYSWRQNQHINVLELLAFFNYLKRACMNLESHATRILHVLDSQVCACVVAKGRSSSRVLNRVLKRVGALCIASDVYVFPLWTISSWNSPDAGSRAWRSSEGIT